jgi:hypothetical protein
MLRRVSRSGFSRESRGTEPAYEFYQSWNSANFPRMIAVSFQHPTPFFDDSYAVNSVNDGPYGDALLTELIPYIEEHFSDDSGALCTLAYWRIYRRLGGYGFAGFSCGFFWRELGFVS